MSRTNVVQAQVDRATLEEIDRLRRSEKRSRSSMIAVLIAEALGARRRARQLLEKAESQP